MDRQVEAVLTNALDETKAQLTEMLTNRNDLIMETMAAVNSIAHIQVKYRQMHGDLITLSAGLHTACTAFAAESPKVLLLLIPEGVGQCVHLDSYTRLAP